MSRDVSESADPRANLFKTVFSFLLAEHFFSAAATMAAEYLEMLRRIEQTEASGNLSASSLKLAAELWQAELSRFQHWSGAADDKDTFRMLRDLEEKGIQRFVADLSVELQIHRPEQSEQK